MEMVTRSAMMIVLQFDLPISVSSFIKINRETWLLILFCIFKIDMKNVEKAFVNKTLLYAINLIIQINSKIKMYFILSLEMRKGIRYVKNNSTRHNNP